MTSNKNSGPFDYEEEEGQYENNPFSDTYWDKLDEINERNTPKEKGFKAQLAYILTTYPMTLTAIVILAVLLVLKIASVIW